MQQQQPQLDRRSALLKEFDEVVAPQKTVLAGRIPDLFTRYYAPPPGLPVPAGLRAQQAGVGAGGASKGSKRAGAAAAGGDGSNKRSRQAGPPLDEFERKLDEFFKEVKNLINRRLWGKKECHPFKEPVDPIKQKLPDYRTFIKNPMDVGTVRRKLETGAYKSPLEARDDLRLVWRNCATYNPPGHPVRNMGDILAAVWESAWAESQIEERWNQFLLQKDPKGQAVPHRVNQLSSQVRSTVQSAHLGAEPDPSQPMTDIEKRKLSVELSELQGDQLLGVLEVLQTDMSGRAEEEVELDMDALPNETLWRLHEYVRNLVRRAVPQAGAPNKTAAAAAEEPAGAASRPAEGAHAAAAGTGACKRGRGRADGHASVAEKAPPSTSKQGEEDADADMAEAEGSQGSDSKSDSHQEFKGSTMDDPSTQNAPNFPRDGRVVDESATGAAEQSTILKEKAGSRKPEVQVNAANWHVSALQQPDGNENEDNEEAADDEVWKQFQTMDEQKRKQAEDQKKLKEQQEQELLRAKEAEQEAARKAQQEAEEREQKLKEEEERIAQEQQRARMEQCDKEVDEIKARQGTANLIQQNDMQSTLMQQPGGKGDLAAVGLVYKNEDEDVNFDDE